MSACPFCSIPCGFDHCPYSEYDLALEKLGKLIEAHKNKPFKFSQEDKDKFTAALLKAYREEE